jgi:NADH-quinone oxidoreductase subunit M
MPGSANFVGEFYILLGVFQAKLVIASVAFTGVILASVYTLRVFIRTMHNREGEKVESRDLSFYDGLTIAPLVLVILALAIYPELPLARSERDVRAAVRPAQLIANPPAPAAAAAPQLPTQPQAPVQPGPAQGGTP